MEGKRPVDIVVDDSAPLIAADTPLSKVGFVGGPPILLSSCAETSQGIVESVDLVPEVGIYRVKC